MSFLRGRACNRIDREFQKFLWRWWATNRARKDRLRRSCLRRARKTRRPAHLTTARLSRSLHLRRARRYRYLRLLQIWPELNCNSPAARSATAPPTLARSIRLVGSIGREPTSSSIFIGRERKTGPRGGDIELWNARRRISGKSSSAFGSKHHLATGAAIPTRSAASNGSARKCRRSCCPAVTTIGTRAIFAFMIAPIPCPRPPEVCRLTKAGLPEACAYPSAIETAVASCSPHTYFISRLVTSASINGNSVVPGLPKMNRVPCDRRTSSRISLPLHWDPVFSVLHLRSTLASIE